MADITMPQLGETVTEGTITRWFKQVGESIAEDEVLFEVSTDKVDSEVPSPAAGVLTEILVQEGETVDVGTVLARVGDGAAGDGAAAAAPAEEAPTAPAGDAPAADAEPTEAPAQEAPIDVQEGGDEGGEPAAQEAPASPAAEAPAGPAAEPPASPAEEVPVSAQEPEVTSAPAGGADQASSSPSPDGPTAAPADYAPEPSSASADGEPSDGAPAGGAMSRLLSPVVRRLIAEHGLDPESIKGTGAGGRITRSDVLQVVEGGARPAAGGGDDLAVAAAETKRLASEEAPAAKGAPLEPDAAAEEREAAEAEARGRSGPAAAPAGLPTGDRDEVVPFTNIRRRTAEHMVRSKATSAHALVVIEVDYANVDRVRQGEKASFKEEEGVALTYLPFVSRAVVDAIREFPIVNSSVGEGELVIHHEVNLGYAVDLSFEGLMVPVVQGADGKRMRALAREVADLADRARRKKLGPDDIAGGTFTITNVGSYGTLMTFPIVNQPQVGILSTDGVRKRPVVVELPDGSDAIVIHPVGNLALSWDHRAFDGAYAAAFMAKVKEILETRDWAAELS